MTATEVNDDQDNDKAADGVKDDDNEVQYGKKGPQTGACYPQGCGK